MESFYVHFQLVMIGTTKYLCPGTESLFRTCGYGMSNETVISWTFILIISNERATRNGRVVLFVRLFRTRTIKHDTLHMLCTPVIISLVPR